MYYVDYTDKAIANLISLQQSEPKAFAKAQRLIGELQEMWRTQKIVKLPPLKD